jgi:hypothetical protein
MAPEILSGSYSYTKAADVFSFAIMIAELWSGKEPYIEQDFQSPTALYEFVMSGKRPTLPSDIDKTIGSIITRNWVQDPTSRQGMKLLFFI